MSSNCLLQPLTIGTEASSLARVIASDGDQATETGEFISDMSQR
jgi:hypothetical protein